MRKPFILAMDQGTTSSRAIVFDQSANIVALSQMEFPQHFPADGWVEHDAEDIWRTSLETARDALAQAEAKGGEVVSIGITNQRETTVIWDRKTLKPIGRAIVWQDRRTASVCKRMKDQGQEGEIRARTGLLLDPYFSATKIAWLLDKHEARSAAEKGDLAFGTIDSFLIARLTQGAEHVTDATNASRTSLFNIRTNEWDSELLRLFDIPEALLPEARDCAQGFGLAHPSMFGRALPIGGVAGDQQAAAVGQACFSPGEAKCTYGTGAFILAPTGEKFVLSNNNLLSTIALRLDGRTTFALEGSIFVAGAAVKWLRDNLGIISTAQETEQLARSIESNRGVYLVPAFTGLGAPHWSPEARGAIYGITRATGRAELVRAALESVVYQTSDLLDAMRADGAAPATLRVDGGMVANAWIVQFLADILNLEVERPAVMETTALGAAYLAGLNAGLYPSLDEIRRNWKREASFKPAIGAEERGGLLSGWRKAVARTLQT